MSDTPKAPSRTIRETRYVGLRALAEQAPPSRSLTMTDIIRTLNRMEPEMEPEMEPAQPGRRVLGRLQLPDGRWVYVVLEAQLEGGYTVCFPGLPGCVTEGDTAEEALANAREASELWLASQ